MSMMPDQSPDSRPFNALPFRIQGDPSRIYRRLPESGLWVGRDVERPRSASGPSLLRSTRIYLTFAEVWERSPDRAEVVEHLRRYNLGTILNGIGQIGSAIHMTHGAGLLETQVGLLQAVFDRHYQDIAEAFVERLREVSEAEAKTPESPVVVFHELQLVNLARLAILEVPPDHAGDAEDFEGLALAILMMNDLLAPKGTVNHPPLEPETEEEIRAWERFLFVNGIFHHNPQPVPELVRAWDLYLTDRPHLRDSDVYHDFPALVEELTGLEPMQLWARLFAVYGHWGKGVDGSSVQFPEPLTQSSYFTDNYSFEPEEEGAFWSLVAAPVEELRERFERSDPSEPYNPYDLLPLETHPLVRIDDHLFCPSALLMKRRMTTGLHHLFLNRIDDPERFLNYMGEVFEDYITGILREAFDHTEGRLITEGDLVAVAPDSPVCDAVVDYGDSLLLVEVKAKRANLDVRVRGDLEKMDAMFEHVFVDAARQIDSVIGLIRRGELAELGLHPARIHRYVPVSVTLDSIPMNPHTYRRLQGRLAEEELLQGGSTLPLQLLAAEDVEALDMAARQGHNALDLLVGRILEDDHQWAGFLSHLFHQFPDLIGEPPPRMGEQFHELGKRAQELFQAREG